MGQPQIKYSFKKLSPMQSIDSPLILRLVIRHSRHLDMLFVFLGCLREKHHGAIFFRFGAYLVIGECHEYVGQGDCGGDLK